MDSFNFTDEEQKVFGELFSHLDVDKQAKLNFKNVTQFLSAYQLSSDDLDKVRMVCYKDFKDFRIFHLLIKSFKKKLV